MSGAGECCWRSNNVFASGDLLLVVFEQFAVKGACSGDGTMCSRTSRVDEIFRIRVVCRDLKFLQQGDRWQTGSTISGRIAAAFPISLACVPLMVKFHRAIVRGSSNLLMSNVIRFGARTSANNVLIDSCATRRLKHLMLKFAHDREFALLSEASGRSQGHSVEPGQSLTARQRAPIGRSLTRSPLSGKFKTLLRNSFRVSAGLRISDRVRA